ncbi:MAG: GAP family protein [Acidobacteriota bacterium]
MTSAALAALLALAIADSINPSAIVVTLYLLALPSPVRRVLIYVAAVFLTYFALGAALLLGIGVVVPDAGGFLDSRPGLALQALAGAALLVYALRASPEQPPASDPAPPSAGTLVALVALGVTVTIMEIPTALPYFAAIAVLSAANIPVVEWLPLLALYNAIFVLPPVALLVGHVVLGPRVGPRYAALAERLKRGAHETALWIAGLVGGGLLATSAIELVARLR